MPTRLRNILYCVPLALGLAWFLGTAAATDDPETMTHNPRKPLPPPDVLAALPPDGGPDYNRLVFAQSPYLLQHAAQPGRLVSVGRGGLRQRPGSRTSRSSSPIGYSTCHWCHVMERESFEDEEVAALMNEYFICIKVDREERPDVDKIYMDVDPGHDRAAAAGP